jgi:hypothetical protein
MKRRAFIAGLAGNGVGIETRQLVNEIVEGRSQDACALRYAIFKLAHVTIGGCRQVGAMAGTTFSSPDSFRRTSRRLHSSHSTGTIRGSLSNMLLSRPLILRL